MFIRWPALQAAACAGYTIDGKRWGCPRSALCGGTRHELQQRGHQWPLPTSTAEESPAVVGHASNRCAEPSLYESSTLERTKKKVLFLMIGPLRCRQMVLGYRRECSEIWGTVFVRGRFIEVSARIHDIAAVIPESRAMEVVRGRSWYNIHHEPAARPYSGGKLVGDQVEFLNDVRMLITSDGP